MNTPQDTEQKWDFGKPHNLQYDNKNVYDALTSNLSLPNEYEYVDKGFHPVAIALIIGAIIGAILF